MRKTPIARVIVFGECLVDVFGDQAVPGGAPFNVARHLAALGLAPRFITRIGRDAHGELLLEALRRYGVPLADVQVDPRRPTGQVRVHERDGHHEFEILPDQAYDAIECPPPEAARGAAEPVPWLVFGSLAQRGAASRAALAQLRARQPHRAFVDLNWRAGQVPAELALGLLDAADELKLSAEELVRMLDWAGLDGHGAADPPRAGAHSDAIARLLASRRVRELLVTYGAGGCALWSAQGRCLQQAGATPVDRLVDTVGAGDAFSAIALAGQLLGWPRALALARAGEFAAWICSQRGAAPRDPEDYAPWKHRWQLEGAPPRA